MPVTLDKIPCLKAKPLGQPPVCLDREKRVGLNKPLRTLKSSKFWRLKISDKNQIIYNKLGASAGELNTGV